MDVTPIIIKKKKSHGHAHHGGSWKVAYADFVTAMMAFFMVMWIMGLSDQTKAQIQGYFNDPIGFVKNQPRSKNVIPLKTVQSHDHGQSKQQQNQPYQAEHSSMKDLKTKLDKVLSADPLLAPLLEHVKIQITDEGLRIEFLEDKDSFFESGQAVLKPAAMRVIKALGPKLSASGRPLIIEGHTDSVPYAGDPYRNFQLSSERATAVLVALGETGIELNKFLHSTGFADRELRDAEHPTSGVNRRVTILLPYIVPATATIPMPKDEINDKIRGAIVPKINLHPTAADVTISKN